MRELQVTARCAVHDGKLDEFRTAAEACMKSVRERDSGTLQYDWFFNEGHTECMVRERYRDSDAVLEHVANLGEAFGSLLAACDLTLELYGNPSDELLQATAGLDIHRFHYYQGK